MLFLYTFFTGGTPRIDATFQKLQNKKRAKEIYLLYFKGFNGFYINLKRFLQMYIFKSKRMGDIRWKVLL